MCMYIYIIKMFQTSYEHVINLLYLIQIEIKSFVLL